MKRDSSTPIAPVFQPWTRRSVESIPLLHRLSIAIGRATRWEFWPAWLYYVPIVVKIIGLGIKHRSFTVFTAVNPGISTGGLVGEAKIETLLPLAANAPDLLAPFDFVGKGQAHLRQQLAERFVAVHGLPCVLKPNVGQRGRGVYIAPSMEAVRDYLLRFPGEVIIQRYVPGEEFGVFVAKHPGTGSLEILSVVNKVFPSVSGDGKMPLRQLILSDARARLIASTLFHRWSGKLDEIIPAGKALQLVEIGAHCRGSVFLDAQHLSTPALIEQMHRLTAAVPGFYFGRIDLRVPDADALRLGQGIQVLEINGVAAESAHIYNPDTPLLSGYRAMFRQWTKAFEIGSYNAKQGAPSTGPLALLKRFKADLQTGDQWF